MNANPSVRVDALGPRLALVEAHPLGILTQPPTDHGDYIRLPDGTFAPALNGVRNPPPMEWPPGVPFSPIVARKTHDGVEWYVHADGSKSTTQALRIPQEINAKNVSNPIKHEN